MITIRQLHYLEALSRHLHFGRAAAECAISQPALSVQIKELEAHLGIMIFERGRKGVVITNSGLEMIKRANEILKGVSDLEDFARGSLGMAGRFRMGIIPTIAPYILPALLPLLQQNYPDMNLVIRESRTEQLVDELASGGLDIIIAALPMGNNVFSVNSLFEDVFVLAMPKKAMPPKQASDLSEFIRSEKLLLLEEGHCLRDQALHHCDIAGIQYGEIFGTSNLTTLVQMVSNGLGLTILPKLCLPHELRDDTIKFVKFQPPEPYREIGIAWRKSSPNGHHFAEIGRLIKIARKNYTNC